MGIYHAIAISLAIFGVCLVWSAVRVWRGRSTWPIEWGADRFELLRCLRTAVGMSLFLAFGHLVLLLLT